MPRRTIGYVNGTAGRFNRSPFFEIRFGKSAVAQFEEMLGRGNASARATVAIAVSYHQPNRLRITEIDPPDYEAAAPPMYVRGDVVRVQGRVGVSCGLDLSARWGVPALRTELQRAAQRAREFVLFRVPSRARDIVEIWPDVDLLDEDALLAASVTAAAAVLPPDDFSDWET